MTLVIGPWDHTKPVVQEAEKQRRNREAEDCKGYAKPDHRPRADPCPPICHACPLLKNPEGLFDVMPGCYDGSMTNELDACTCDYDGPAASGMGASW